MRTLRFRLVNNTELYDITNNPSEKTNVIEKFTEEVFRMRKARCNQWRAAVRPEIINDKL